MGADAGGDGFLADIRVAGSMDESAGVAAGQLLLGGADELHGAVEVHCGFRMVPPALRARLPPSMGMMAPVIHFDASDARRTARPLMSSGCPKRPAGIPLRNLSLSDGSAAMR